MPTYPYNPQFTPFHTTSSYRSNQIVSSAGEYKKTATMNLEDGWEALSPCAVPMTSVSSMTSVVSSSRSASEESAAEGAMACISPFRSTSAYMSCVSDNGMRAMAIAVRTAGSAAMAQTTAAAYAAQSPALAASTTPARSIDMADVINFYTLAEELFGEKIAWGDTQASGYRRPDNPIGELTPVGDAILPLMACVIVYAVYKILRKMNLRKANNV